MKVRSLLLITILLTVNFIGAQDFGIKGGLNLGRFIGSDVDNISYGLNQKFEPGFEGGIFMAFPINPIELRVEALFLHTGTKFEETDSSTTEKYRYNLNYITVPILAGININNFRIFAGPYINFYLFGKIKYKIENDGRYYDEDEKIEKDDVNSVPMGIILGTSYRIFDNLELELRYLQGITNLFDVNLIENLDELSAKPMILQLYANFHLAK